MAKWIRKTLDISLPLDSKSLPSLQTNFMSLYEDLKNTLTTSRERWLVTGAAGFIGSHLVEALLKLNRCVVGLRYFNVFSPRQNPNGAYAAVIPKWISCMMNSKRIHINGTGEISRDFCYIENVAQANFLAVKTTNPEALNRSFNIAVQDRTSLNDLFKMLRHLLLSREPHLQVPNPRYRDFRRGDVMHSLADVGAAKSLLGYRPTHSLRQGLESKIDWYLKGTDKECIESAQKQVFLELRSYSFVLIRIASFPWLRFHLARFMDRLEDLIISGSRQFSAQPTNCPR